MSEPESERRMRKMKYFGLLLSINRERLRDKKSENQIMKYIICKVLIEIKWKKTETKNSSKLNHTIFAITESGRMITWFLTYRREDARNSE